jgi:phosphate starvation-inducible PhoH-like protein
MAAWERLTPKQRQRAERKQRRGDARRRQDEKIRGLMAAPDPWERNEDRPDRDPIKPLNPRQANFLTAMDGPMVFAMGPAGAGKTFLAAGTAADRLAAGQVKKVILTRPAVGADEEHGFLPGRIEEKIAPWARVYTDVMERRLGRQKFQSAMRSGVIEVIPFAFMRGLTFADAFTILDEAQNTTVGQMKMFLTRIGENTTTVVNGDIRQTDLKVDSGLKVALELIRRQGLPVPVIEFTNADIVRSGLCRMWAEAFDRHELAAAV